LLAMLAEHTSVKTALLVACVAFLPAGAAVFALPKTVRRGRR
jgi:hypothetical protein